MNPDNFVQLAQKGFHVTLGAAAFMIETVQDPQRRDTNLSRLQSDFTQLAEEWEAKGESAEREARKFVDGLLSQQFNQAHQSTSTTSAPANPASSTTSPDIQQDLQELTLQLAAIRTELERLRETNS